MYISCQTAYDGRYPFVTIYIATICSPGQNVAAVTYKAKHYRTQQVDEEDDVEK